MPENLISELVGITGNFAAFGLISWLVRHTFRNTIPRLAKNFSEALDKQREEFSRMLVSHRDEFSRVINDQRKEFIAELHTNREEARQERVACNNCLAEVQSELVHLGRVLNLPTNRLHDKSKIKP